FHQVFGTSPYAYYQVARLQEAKRLLAQWSVSEVGHQLGFTNLGHFAQLFKRQYGLTPKRYQAVQDRAGAE
ncbi:MAG: AraC family transcriptional regulator, partial [Hymenobacter sp.]